MPLDNPFEKYGIKRVINAATSITTLGGSIPDQRIFKAMAEAGKAFASIPELQVWAGNEIAKATGAEAGLPVASAVCGLQLSAAACMMRGTELEKYKPLGMKGWSHITMRLPLHTEGLRTEFIVQSSNRNSYDYSVELAGGMFMEVEPTEEALIDAYDQEKTAAYYYTARNLKGSLPLEKVIEIAKVNNVPVIVDAAAEIPPRRKLRMYMDKGADLVSYSGGKHLAGPNNSGLLAGRADLIKLAHLQSYPFNGVGRASKMSRETIVGLVEALWIFLSHDEEGAFNRYVKWAEYFRDELSKERGVSTEIVYQRVVEDGEPMAPFCALSLDESVTGVTGKELVTRLKEGDPVVYVLYEPEFLLGPCPGKITLNPQYMLEGEHPRVVEKIKRILES
ncbi:aminotransferase class V-fold PLP-dependent enzyme [Candidatus Bathyarchaeota archaeon]|nr:aminotransferase class V-fold PLP-dependent enzyme [Candidatus Bathyarchaeota archaeon]